MSELIGVAAGAGASFMSADSLTSAGATTARGQLRRFWRRPGMTHMGVHETVGLDDRSWREIVAHYQRPDTARALLQLATTLLPLIASFAIMYRLLAVSLWWTLLLAVPTAGLLVRTFILMHDCAHGSFFASRRANRLVGAVTGLLTLTPFDQWRHEHALHHASAGDLDRRGHGDVDTLTVREYLGRTRWGRLRYRLVRHPAIFLGLGPIFFLFEQRVPPRGPAAGNRQILSVWTTNAVIVAVAGTLAALVGLRTVLLIYLPVYYFALAAGILLFFVQHQFEDTYWEQHAQWSYVDAAIAGSSYFRLPAVLRWFTGNIGLHHVHHLGPRIPNYHLQRCHDENPLFHRVTVLTLAQSLRALCLALWDEDAGRLVAIGEARRREREHGLRADSGREHPGSAYLLERSADNSERTSR